MVDAAFKWGALYVIQWNVHDHDEISDFGMFDLAGKLTDLGQYYKEEIAADRFRHAPSRNPVTNPTPTWLLDRR